MKQIKIQVLQIKSLVSSPAINHHIIPSSICTKLSTVPFLEVPGHRSPDFHEPVFSNSTQATLLFPSSTAPEMSKSVTPSFVGLFFPSPPSFLPSFLPSFSFSLSFPPSFSPSLSPEKLKAPANSYVTNHVKEDPLAPVKSSENCNPS